MTNRPGNPPEGMRFEVDARTGVVSTVPVAVGPGDRIRLPPYAQWRRALMERVGDGAALYDALLELVSGVTRIAVYPADFHEERLRGQPILTPTKFGYETLAIVVPPAVRLAATRELLDRAFGKPVQVVVDATPQDQDVYVPPAELDEATAAMLRELAKRRMLGRASEQPPTDEEDDDDGDV